MQFQMQRLKRWYYCIKTYWCITRQLCKFNWIDKHGAVQVAEASGGDKCNTKVTFETEIRQPINFYLVLASISLDPPNREM